MLHLVVAAHYTRIKESRLTSEKFHTPPLKFDRLFLILTDCLPTQLWFFYIHLQVLLIRTDACHFPTLFYNVISWQQNSSSSLSSVVSKQMTDLNDRLPIRTVLRMLKLVSVKQKQHSCCSNIKVVTQHVTGCVLLLSTVTNLILSHENSDLLPRGLTWNSKLLMWQVKFFERAVKAYRHEVIFYYIVYNKALNGRERHSLCLFIHRADWSIMWMYSCYIMNQNQNAFHNMKTMDCMHINGNKQCTKSIFWHLKSVNTCL